MVADRKSTKETELHLTSSEAGEQQLKATSAYDGDTDAAAALPSDAASLSLPNYRLQGSIARGGMGEVHRAFDVRFQRHLAIKVLLPRFAQHADVRRRFLEEAKIMAQLQHPGVPPVHDQGELPDGRPFMAMKLIRGETLAEILLRRDNVSDDLPRLIDVFEQVCQTLAYAHSQGVIHRDLKPSNIMVGAFGEVQVMDWGLAKTTETTSDSSADGHSESGLSTLLQNSDSAGDKTQMGQFLGTPAYAAPEQARGEIERLDARCDVFGLGAILCQILTGKPPFADTSKERALSQAMQGQLDDAWRRIDARQADPIVTSLARKCLAPNWEDRPAHGGEVAELVADYRATVQQRMRAADMSRAAAEAKAVEERKRRRAVMGLGGAAIVLLIAAAAISLLLMQNRAAQTAERARVESTRAARASLVTDAVQAAIAESQQLREQLHNDLADPIKANRLMSDLREWERQLESARAAFQRARALVASEASLDASLREDVQQFQASLQSDERNFETARRLDNIRLARFSLKSANIERDEAATQVAHTLQGVGLDLKRKSTGELGEAIRTSPLRWVLIGALTFWASATEDRPQVERLLELLRHADPDPWRDQLRSVDAWWDMERLTELADSVDPSQQSPQTLHALAMRLQKTEGDSTPMLRRALSHHPRDFWLHFQLGANLKNYSEKAGSFRAALAIRSDSDVTHANLGLSLAGLRDNAAATHHFQEALKINPELARAHSALAGLFTHAKDLEQARHHQARAVEIAPDDHMIRYEIGLVCYRQGQYEASEEHLSRAVQIKPHWTAYHEWLGASLLKQSKWESARPHYEKLIELQPKNPEFHFQLGAVLVRLGEHQQALESLRQAAQLGGGDDDWAKKCEPWIQIAQMAVEKEE